MARSKAQAEALRQILLAAVAKYTGKEHERDQLAEGSKVEVDVELSGVIDCKRIEDHFEGTLTVGFDQETAKSTGVKAEHLAAWILDRYVPPSQYVQLFDELPKLFDAHGGVPLDELDNDELPARCEALVKKLAANGTQTRKGDVKLNYARSA